MKIEDDMVIEKLDLDYLLRSYLRSYLFYNKNIAPNKIVIPMIPAIKSDMSGEMVPVEFVEFKPEQVTPEEALIEPPVPVEESKKESKKRLPTGQDTA